MIINIIGDCDKRPVLFTVMKICQALGDVLLITSSSRLLRLSDTGESLGHYQNTMIGVTFDGIDDFWENFTYDSTDFEYTIIDNIISADSDVIIYVRGMIESEAEKDNLEYIEKYSTIDLYAGGKLVDSKTLLNCEEFEAYRDMCPINPKLSKLVADILAPAINTSSKHLEDLANVPTSTHPKSLPSTQPKKKSLGFLQKG